MDTLSDYILFGEKFIRFRPNIPYGNTHFINLGRLSNQAIECLNYLQPYIMKGNMPQKDSNNTLSLYSYITDREEFEENPFEGFASLENYEDCHLLEYYYNKYDNITIYVYDCDKYSIKNLNYINKNKCLFL
jgi:hypothetical protein